MTGGTPPINIADYQAGAVKSAQGGQAETAKQAFSLREDAARAHDFHTRQAAKAAAAHDFLAKNPAFGDFVLLIRSGAIQF